MGTIAITICDLCGSHKANKYKLNEQPKEKGQWGAYVASIDLCENCLTTKAKPKMSRKPSNHTRLAQVWSAGKVALAEKEAAPQYVPPKPKAGKAVATK